MRTRRKKLGYVENQYRIDNRDRAACALAQGPRRKTQPRSIKMMKPEPEQPMSEDERRFVAMTDATPPDREGSVACSDWLGDWAYRCARHLRNTEKISHLKWGVEACDLLAELRDHDPARYEREVKSPNVGTQAQSPRTETTSEGAR